MQEREALAVLFDTFRAPHTEQCPLLSNLQLARERRERRGATTAQVRMVVVVIGSR